MIDAISQFGTIELAATYILRPGGYAVVFRASRQIALVAVNGHFYLPGGGQENGEDAEAAALREAFNNNSVGHAIPSSVI